MGVNTQENRTKAPAEEDVSSAFISSPPTWVTTGFSPGPPPTSFLPFPHLRTCPPPPNPNPQVGVLKGVKGGNYFFVCTSHFKHYSFIQLLIIEHPQIWSQVTSVRTDQDSFALQWKCLQIQTSRGSKEAKGWVFRMVENSESLPFIFLIFLFSHFFF